jgi:hypothetical protein
MMREHVDTPIAAPKERAQQPTNDRNDDRAEKCTPKAGNFKTWHDLPNEFQHQRINN